MCEGLQGPTIMSPHPGGGQFFFRKRALFFRFQGDWW
jgi:hypothetical protein